MSDAPEAELIRQLGPRTKVLLLVAEAQAGLLPCGKMAALLELVAADPAEKSALALAVIETLSASGVHSGRIDDLRKAFGLAGASPATDQEAETKHADTTRSQQTVSLKSSFRAAFDNGTASPAAPPAPPATPAAPEPALPELPAKPQEGAAHHGLSEPPTVLIADDDEHFRMVLRIELEGKGFNVIEAADGLEAWDRLQAGSIGAVVLDMKMPGLHGLDILSRLAELGGKLPVVVCTAYDQIIEDEIVVASYLPLRTLTKPVDTRHLAETVINLLAEQV